MKQDTNHETNQVTILTSPTCGYCHAAKNLLQSKGIDYSEVDAVRNVEEAQALLQKSGQLTVPQIFVNDHSIGGYTDLAALFSQPDFDLAKVAVSNT